MNKPLFTHEVLSERLVRIIDISYTAVYLVLGDEKTALIDTGVGIGSLKSYIEETFNKKVDLVILTHGHLDHASGAKEFEDLPVYLNPNDLTLMNTHGNIEDRVGYAKTSYRRVNKEDLDINPEDIIQPMDSAKTLALNDKDEFDLGGITVKAIAAPGHTQGMTMTLFKEERTILFGDGCGVGVLLVEDCCSTVSEYMKSLQNVKQYEDQYDTIIRNHGTYHSEKALLDNVIEVCQEILNGTDDHILADESHLPMKLDEPAYQAKATLPNSQIRVDGKEGNITYKQSKVH